MHYRTESGERSVVKQRLTQAFHITKCPLVAAGYCSMFPATFAAPNWPGSASPKAAKGQSSLFRLLCSALVAIFGGSQNARQAHRAPSAEASIERKASPAMDDSRRLHPLPRISLSRAHRIARPELWAFRVSSSAPLYSPSRYVCPSCLLPSAWDRADASMQNAGGHLFWPRPHP